MREDNRNPNVQIMLCRALVRFAAVLAVAGLGCGRQPAPLERYVPSSELARSAVEAVLDDWKAGLAPGQIDRLSVGVIVVDNQRRSGQRLDDFEILGEVPGEAGRSLAVRLKLSRPEAEEKVRYVVIGIDPLWVYRHEDLEMLSHWEHPMPTDAPAIPQPKFDEIPTSNEGPDSNSEIEDSNREEVTSEGNRG